MSSKVAEALPPSILALFAPRPPLGYKKPIEKGKLPKYQGISQFVDQFVESSTETQETRVITVPETKEEKKVRIAADRASKDVERLAALAETWDPQKDSKVKGDPYKTLFISRLSFETTEQKLKRDFEAYGPVKRMRLVYDVETQKPRGYAFIEFESERDMKAAYKQADGKKIDGRRVLVDVERGRTVRNWKPRKLGGGLGATRAGGDDINQRYSGRYCAT